MYFGADYYPEHWSESRWPLDAELMNEAGINIVRVAEFSWAKMEPREGSFDFSWLDRAIAVLAAKGIKVVMGTPTATPPKWLMDAHPEIYMEDEKGVVRGFGSRRHYCYNSAVYRSYAERVVTALVEHYAGNPSVAAWQIDNEFSCGDGMYCYCEDCRLAFIEWLKRKYGSLDALNAAWGTVFWSQTYTDWSEIIVPKYSAAGMFGNNGHNPALNLDYSRFSSDSIVDFCAIQSRIIKARSSAPVTHNVVMELYDYYSMGPLLDIATYDNYPKTPWGDFLGSAQHDPAFAMDTERGIKNKNYWVMEQQSGPCGWNTLGDTPKPGQIRLWTYQSLAHGAESIIYFRWRACLFGTEQYWYGILDHDGKPRRRYAEVSAIGADFPKISALNDGSRVDADILMIRSFEQQWSHKYQEHNARFDYRAYLKSLYLGFYARSYNLDISSIDSDLSRYKLVLAPAFNLMNEDWKRRLEAYVRSGGNLVVTFRSGTKNMDNSMTELSLPGYFKELAGIELEEFDSLNGGRTVAVSGAFGEGRASIWADVIAPGGAETVASYTEEFYEGKPAITASRFGAGTCYYVGCDLDPAATSALLAYIARRSGVEPAIEGAPAGVEVVRKVAADGRKFYFAMNFNADPATLDLPRPLRDAVTGAALGRRVELEPYGSAILL
jgi:Beta-galactosidase